MKRFPLIPTVFVIVAVAVMIGLGIWQLRRAEWKERMLADLQAAPSLPALDLDPLLANGNPRNVPLAFRRVLVSCTPSEAAPSLRAGRNRRAITGYSYFVRCRPADGALGGRIEVNAGWSQQPNQSLRPQLPRIVAGVFGTVEPDGPIILTAAAPAQGLESSAPPSIEDIPNNHMAYAFQWFFFAATALLIYILALRRRSVAPPPSEP